MHTRNLRSCILLVFALSAMFCMHGNCQTSSSDYVYATGNPNFSVNIPVENGFINVANGDLHLEFPLSQLKQRGNLALDEKLVYDSRVWMIGHYSNYYWWPTNVPNSSDGWRFVTGAETGTVSQVYISETSGYCDPNWESDGDTDQCDQYNISYNWTDPSNTVHQFDVVWHYQAGAPNGPSPESAWGYAADASGYAIHLSGNDDQAPTSIAIYDTNGTQVYPQVIDRFGNNYSTDANGNLIDSLGRTPVVVTQDGNVTYYDVLTEGGNRARYTVTMESLSIRTQFGQSGVNEWSGTLSAVQSIELPDGSSYSFTYDGYGEMTGMTLPTGYTVGYGWSNYFDSYNNANRWLTQLDGGVTTFTPSVVTQCSGSNDTGCQEQVVMHRPSGDEVKYLLTLNNGAWDTTTTIYNGAASGGTAIESQANTYNFTTWCTAYCWAGSAYITESTQTTTLSDTGAESKVEYDYNDQFLDVPTAVKKWNYGSSFSGTPTQETDYSYNNNAGLSFLIASETVKDSGGNQAAQTTYHYTTSANTTSGIVGHGATNAGGPYLQSVSRWLNTTGAWLTTTNTSIDDTGSVLAVQDARGNTTTYGYDSTDTFVTSVTRPTTSNGVAHVLKTEYDPSTGLVTRTDDENSVAHGQAYSTYYSYFQSGSSIGRLQQVQTYGGGLTTYSYPNPNEVDTSVLQAGSTSLTTATIVDSRGRPYKKVSGDTYTETTYDGDGRAYCVTNPQSSSGYSSTDGGVCTYYDGADRPISKSMQDGNSMTMQYSGNTVTVTDEVGHKKEYASDAFGQLTDVWEPDSTGALNWHTQYTFNALGEMLTATQMGGTTDTTQWRTRSWTYDSLGRKLTETAPESNMTCYGVFSGSTCNSSVAYDANGNLLQATDARGNTDTVTTSYDELNRPTSVQGSGINYSFVYDVSSLSDGTSTSNAVNRLAAEYSDGHATNVYSYDALGRISVKSGWTPSHPSSTANAIGLQYDLASNITSITYPDGRTVGQQFDGDNRLSQVNYQSWNGTSVGTPYWSNPTYMPTGEVASAQLGQNIHAAAAFNSRMSITSLAYSTNSNTLWSKTYQWDKNAVNLTDIIDGKTGVNRVMSYDNNNRLTAAADMTGQATPGTASVEITGYEQEETYDYCSDYYSENGVTYYGDWAGQWFDGSEYSCPMNFYDDGLTTVTVNGYQAWSRYGNLNGELYSWSGSATDIANDLAQQINANTPVTASVTTQDYGAIADITLTANSAGANTNYSLSADSETWDQYGLWTSPSFYAYPSGSSLTGGADGGQQVSGGLQESYSYDAWGNLSQSGNYSFQPTQWTAGNQVADSGYGYDSAGNMTTESIPGVGSRSYTYNPFSQLTNSGAASYTYDVDGNRIREDGTSNGSTEYVYLGGLLLGAYNVSAGTWTDMIYAGNQFIAEVGGTQSAQPNYRLTDHLGSLVMLTDSSGNQLGTWDYTPYGQVLSHSGTDDARLFTGLPWDADTNSSHATARQLMGVEGRWLTPDPYRGSYDWSNPQSFNRYMYVNGMPMAYRDPSGLNGWGIAVNIALCFGGSNPAGCVAEVTSGPVGWITLGTSALLEALHIALFSSSAFHGSLQSRPSTPNTQCSDVPNAPPGASASQNLQIAQQATQSMGPASKTGYIYETFKTGGAFDYKTTYGGAGWGPDKNQFVDYGNWNFGYVCGGLTGDPLFCKSAAGINRMWRAATQLKNPFDSGIPFFKKPYGDQARDDAQIQNGLDAEASGCTQ